MGLVKSWNEWDPLEEVIIGTALDANVPRPDIGQDCIEFSSNDLDRVNRVGAFPYEVIEETEEDLSLFADTLRTLGIIVRRPAPFLHERCFATQEWETTGFYSYCPRDSVLVVGDRLIETPMALRCRYYEATAYRELLQEYFASGARWLSAPKPLLLDDLYCASEAGQLPLKNLEPIFDAANVLRAGRDLLFQISSTGNELGRQWLSSILGDDFRVHPCHNLYNSIHIDSTVALLRPGLALLNPERVNDSNMPGFIKRWDRIWCPPCVDIGYTRHAYSSVWVGMNVLSINPNLAVVESRQLELIRILERHKIDVLPLTLRHARTLGGGFHCTTLDIRRSGCLEDYS